MPHLHRLSEISSRHSEDFQDAGMYNPVGSTAYLAGRQAIGTVRDALVDDTYGRIRYLMVDADGGDLQGARLIPIGLARLEDDGVYFDDLTAAQLSAMHRYSADEEYTFDLQSSDERVLRGQMDTQAGGERVLHAAGTAATTGAAASYNYRDDDASDRMFKGSPRLQLLEERLSVNKEKYRAGSVEIGKHVETRQETVNVPLQREEVVIERHAVTDARPVQGDVLGAASETVRVELEAERAQVAKQAYVTEEVEVGKRTVTEQQTVTETVGREVLDVNQTGDVELLTDEANRKNRN
ncbi:DUF2382 domain-containing protein [Deinococcus budaensis]|uniref:Uncharacterized protein (TIGR02271 family) n=1 Tax=Deinococcus budaensis TaxID=1665626 RepID=A0A7W8GI67_9DEIO|nr:DUF2382 domain-containing protein [Deinococcus budaensis]MBB5235733.1 uncharacterized protein (TIGR02271 family) [Deinococcus budaensis]